MFGEGGALEVTITLAADSSLIRILPVFLPHFILIVIVIDFIVIVIVLIIIFILYDLNLDLRPLSPKFLKIHCILITLQILKASA